jgi:regulator of protease activity HflC (stomatin/prohibitin superfamily)
VTVQIAVQYRVINEMVRERRPSRSVQDDTVTKPLLQSNGELVSASDMNRGAADELLGHGVCRAYYRLTDIVVQLTPYVEDVVRSEVPKRTLDEAYESKEAVALAVKSALSMEMQRYGYEIVNALVTDLQPDVNVLTAMNQIEAQRRMRMAAQEKAEGEKILIVKAAEADAESKYLSGAGVARQRRAIVDGLKESVMDFNDSVVGTTPTDVMQLMMVTQYLDMLKEVGCKDKATTVFIPHAPSSVNDIQGQMRQGFMEANLSAQSNARPVVARPTRD